MPGEQNGGRGLSSAPADNQLRASSDQVTAAGTDGSANPFAAGTGPEPGDKRSHSAALRERRTEPKPGDTRKYSASLLEGRSEPWAKKMRRCIEITNRDRETGKKACNTFTGAEATQCGAPSTDLDALRPLTDEERRWHLIEANAAGEADKLRLRERAKQMVRTDGGSVEPPDPISLTDMLEQPDDDATYRIASLWPTGGRVLLAAQYKAGKSTLVGNVLRALVDGDPLLGKFDPTTARRVALLDTELDVRTLRRWLRDQGIRNTEAITVVPLRGKVSSFDILDAETRAMWARRLTGTEVVILDCVRPVLDALGLSEDKDAGRFLVAFDELLAEAVAGEALAVTHMGHQNERARGDSRLLDWPDALWKIVRDEKAKPEDVPR